MQKIDKHSCDIIKDRMTQALKALSDELGVHVTVGHMTYSKANTWVSVDVEVAVKGEGGKPLNRAAEDFAFYARLHGFKPEDLGREFTGNTNRYRITGWNPKARKMPVIAEDVATGHKIKAGADYVLDRLRQEDARQEQQRAAG